MAEKTLFLLRHAKSSWAEAGLEDHERPLAARGRRAAKLLRRHLRQEGIEPDLVLCSSSRRTRETLERVGPAGTHEVEHGLYAASDDALLERLRRLPEEVGSVMVIGHNPGLEELAGGLAGESWDKFPTGALATIAFAGKWRDLGPAGAELVAFVTPRQLAGQ